MKDYYSILQIGPLTTRDEIKRQYRRLAKQYHPDINGNDAYASAKFQDIKEAYLTLTQPSKKEAWLRERWLRQAYHQGPGETNPLTPFSILEKVLKLERSVAGMDIFRMDHAGVIKSVENILSSENLDCLEKFHEPEMNRSIIRHILLALPAIPYHLLEPVLSQMKAFAGQDAESIGMISSFQKKYRRKHRADQWTVPLVLFATLIICVLIYLGSR
jgi:hypothetical protein